MGVDEICKYDWGMSGYMERWKAQLAVQPYGKYDISCSLLLISDHSSVIHTTNCLQICELWSLFTSTRSDSICDSERFSFFTFDKIADIASFRFVKKCFRTDNQKWYSLCNEIMAAPDLYKSEVFRKQSKRQLIKCGRKHTNITALSRWKPENSSTLTLWHFEDQFKAPTWDKNIHMQYQVSKCLFIT